MSSGNHLSVRVLILLGCLCALPFLLGGCSDPAGEAEFQIARGELEAAELSLGDATGKRVRSLHARIAALREERVRTEKKIDELVALAADGDMQTARVGLRKLAGKANDFRASAAIDQARSDLADLAAAEVNRRSLASKEAPRGTTKLSGEPEVDVRARETALVNSLVERIVDQVNSLVSDQDWVRARSLVKMAMSSSGEHASSLRELLASVETSARAEMKSLIAEAESIEGERGTEAAFEFLVAEASRFPQSGGFAGYHERVAELGGGLSEPVRLAVAKAAAKPEKAPTPDRTSRLKPPSMPEELREPTSPATEPTSGSDENAMELLVSASKLEDAGQLAAARDEWELASEAFPRGRQRQQAAQHAENLEARLALRSEVAAAVEARADYFLLLGIDSVDQEFFVVHGEPVPWREVEDSVFERVMLLCSLSNTARIGWIQELWIRGNENAPHELAAALARDEVSEQQAWSILAHANSEPVPDDGYAYEGGEWADRGAARRALMAVEFKKLSKKLAKASAANREEAYAGLLAQGVDAREVLSEALLKRWDTAFVNLERGATLGQLQKLIEQREVLDARREEALALIFDEEEYFYPYNPPECPQEKAKLYPAVQRRVDELVGRVREAWDSSKTVSVPEKFRGAVSEVVWNRQHQRELGQTFEAPMELPAWLAGIDPKASEVTLHSFAWNAAEATARAYDGSVLAFNERQWETFEPAEGEEVSEPEAGEQEQVRITNAYRMMLGRRALAWNSRVQIAAQEHSDWMSRTGIFSHFNNRDATRTTPGDRMRLAGYNSGISENLHLGGSGPQGAHNGWSRSSGHHRNLLMPGHREIASATSGQFWTQNFGAGREFLEELKAWYD